MFRILCLTFAVAVFSPAAERTFDLLTQSEGSLPSGWRSTMTGAGKPGDWKIVMDDTPLLTPFFEKARTATLRPVLAQLSTDKNENRAPILLFDLDTFSDFTFSTRIRIVSGSIEQMAGIAFRLENETNYYYVRLNAKDHNVAFFRYVEGELIGPISAPADIKTGEWNTLAVECKGAKLRALLNDKEVIPWSEPNYVPLPNGTSKGVFSAGKVGLWTKADTVAHFLPLSIVYTPHEPFAQTLIRETISRNPRLLGLKIFARRDGGSPPRIIGSDKPAEVGEPGETVEANCIDKGGIYSGKGKETAVATLPLHDRNGDVVGAVRVVMTTFFGQTEKNILARALPIVKTMEEQISSARELMQ